MNQVQSTCYATKSKQGWKILKISTRPTSPYVLVNSIIYIGNGQNFYSSCNMKHSPCRADEWIFPALLRVALQMKFFASQFNVKSGVVC